MWLSDSLVKSATGWLDSRWLLRRICKRHFPSVQQLTFRPLRAMRLRRVHLVEWAGDRCVVDLTLRRSVTRVAVQAALLAQDRGVPVARVLGSDWSLPGLLRYGTSYAVYDFVRGRHPEYDCELEDLRAIARTYGRLHTIAAPDRDVMRPLRISNYMEKWDAGIRQFAAASHVLRWLRETVPPEEKEELYLNHGDANRGNSIINGAGNAVLIDLGTAHFGWPLFEFVYLLLHYGQRDAERRQAFVDAYFEQNVPLRMTWEERSAFFLVGGLLERLCWRVESARAWKQRGRNDQVQSRYRSISDGFDRILKLTQLYSGGNGEFTDVLSECWE